MPLDDAGFDALDGTPKRFGGGEVSKSVLAQIPEKGAISFTELSKKLKKLTGRQIKVAIYNVATNPKVKIKKVEIKYNADHEPFYRRIATAVKEGA